MSFLTKNTKIADLIEEETREIALFSDLSEMWQYNWAMFNKSNGDLKWIIKNESDREEYEALETEYDKEVFLPFALLDAQFLVLMDHWFEITKQSSNRDELYTLMRKAIVARNRYINGDKFQINLIRKFEQMITDLTGDSTGWDPDKELMALSVQSKFMIDDKAISVVKYQKLIEVITEMHTPKTTIDGENV